MNRPYAIILVWVFLWWLGSAIVDGWHRGNPAFIEVYGRFMNRPYQGGMR